MLYKFRTYRIVRKAVAIFLLAGMLLPSVMQGKQLVDDCSMERNHSEMTANSHDCCLPQETNHSNAQKNIDDCNNGQICTCSVDDNLVNAPFRVPLANSSAVVLSENGFIFSINSPDVFIYQDYFASGQASPPLYLLYNTFLN